MDYKDIKSGDTEVYEAVKKYNEDEEFTYADYEKWDDGKRYELIDGFAYMMSAPSTAHQSILTELSRQFANYLKGRPCRVFPAPYDVCLNGLGDKDKDVVQPDIIIICNESIIDKKRCNGAPDMAIEILSPSTSKMDLFIKLEKYQKAGVREYWIVDPDAQTVNVNLLENSHYVVTSYECGDTIAVAVLDGCNITLMDVFE